MRTTARSALRPFTADVAGSILLLSSGQAIYGLFGFIASKRLGASIALVGLLGSAAYWGYLWNFFLSRVTAKVSIRQSILAVAALSGAFLLAAGFQRNAFPYALAVIAHLLFIGLFDVQYNSIIPHLYGEAERPRRLSIRYLGIAAGTVVLSAAFGRISAGRGGHLAAFALCAVFMLSAGLVFRSLGVAARGRMDPFGLRDVLRTVFSDRKFRAAAAVLTLYGWVGAGSPTVLVLLYKRAQFDEWTVGLLGSLSVVGTVLSTLLVTPRLGFDRGIANFRLCFYASLAAVVTYALAWFTPASANPFWIMACGNLFFGVSNAGFSLAVQTTPLNLALPGKETLAVNSFMSVLGFRGMLAPLAVAAFLGWAGIGPTLIVSIVVAVACVLRVAFEPSMPARNRVDPMIRK